METAKQNLNTLSDRLVFALELTGTRKADLARAINVKPQVIQFLCSSKTMASRFTFEIATALGLNTRWLATGDGTIFTADDEKYQLLKLYKRVPLLGSDDIMKIKKMSDLNKLEPKDWLALKTDEDDLFAMVMPDESMNPLIPKGAEIFVKLNKDVPVDIHKKNNIVLVYLKQFNALIIRKILSNGEIPYLMPENSAAYIEMKFSDDMDIIGFVHNCHFSLRG